MHQAFSFLDRFLAKSSHFFSILPNFYFAPRSAAQSSLMSLGSHMHTLDTLRSARVPPARHAQPPASSSRALGSVCWPLQIPLQELCLLFTHAPAPLGRLTRLRIKRFQMLLAF